MDINKLTDFNDTSDVSDAAIKWVLERTNNPYSGARTPGYTRESVNLFWAKNVILVARLIQQTHPELFVDPDLKAAREILAAIYEAEGYHWDAEELRGMAASGFPPLCNIPHCCLP